MTATQTYEAPVMPMVMRAPVAPTDAQTLVSRTNRNMSIAASQVWDDTEDSRSAALSLLKQFGAAASALEELGWPAERIQEALRPSREVCATASLMHRCQVWPRGYAGDFETIEFLAGAANYSKPGTIGWQFDEILLNSPVAQQHRNKLQRQTAEIARCILRKNDARVLSIACGGCLDWVPMLPVLADFNGEIVLNDCEPEALELASRRLGSVTERFRTVAGNVLRVANRLGSGQRFDLVVAGGLFDYLSDKAISMLLRTIYAKLLAPGGVVLFTNIAQGNPFRPLMEHGSNWNLIERTEEQLVELCVEAGMGRHEVTVTRDATGLALLAMVKKTDLRN